MRELKGFTGRNISDTTERDLYNFAGRNLSDDNDKLKALSLELKRFPYDFPIALTDAETRDLKDVE